MNTFTTNPKNYDIYHKGELEREGEREREGEEGGEGGRGSVAAFSSGQFSSLGPRPFPCRFILSAFPHHDLLYMYVLSAGIICV